MYEKYKDYKKKSSDSFEIEEAAKETGKGKVGSDSNPTDK